ncbi:MAG TPA: hypothetical protein PK505_08165, partial [Treponemataceae bacterium]|nr:hypothetical protein [Treponemataceae bacterium]
KGFDGSDEEGQGLRKGFDGSVDEGRGVGYLDNPDCDGINAGSRQKMQGNEKGKGLRKGYSGSSGKGNRNK